MTEKPWGKITLIRWGLIHKGCQVYKVSCTAEAQHMHELHRPKAISATTTVSTCLPKGTRTSSGTSHLQTYHI